ncbi:MAG: LysM peptidoglycan-binding domain-containing protein [Chloroflexi bacterium]|nr:LysM peptidoglycan-binding domain-containing protein [Chloroflexota bacterium]
MQPIPRAPARARSRQSSTADPRRLATVFGLIAAVAVMAWFVPRMQQATEKRVEAPPATAQVVPAAKPTVPQPPAPTPPAQRPGEGPLRSSVKIVEPTYTVVAGETLGSIARKLNTTVEALQGINNLADRNVLSVGQKLVVPSQ